ncbi:MAG: DinB family protein [Acidobacteriota bacterium]
MSKALSVRPATDEHAEYYARYTSLVADGNIVETLENQLASTLNFLKEISEEKANSRYAPDKWSIKEVLGHIIDGERIFAYRALRIARNDKTPLPGFEQDGYIEAGNFAARSFADLLEEFKCVRQASLFLFRNLDEAAWLRRGTASDNEVSVRALAYIIAGHELHHLSVIKEKYL